MGDIEMLHVKRSGETIGYIERFRGNKPKEQWVAFRLRLPGDNETFPSRRRGFVTRKAAIEWLDKEEVYSTSIDA